MTSPVNRPTMNLAEADAVYSPLHRLSPPDGIAIERDVPYGPDPRHLLDVASPPTVAAMRPVLVFVHGGAFVAGERRRPGTPFHDNVMLWAAEQGWVGVNLTYRLAPRHPWPAGGDDVLRAMRWLQNHLSRWNGDPNRTFLFGHSAGAAHAAEALVRSATDDAAAAWAGTLLLSGIYAPAAAESNPGREAYYGADRHLWHARGASDRLSRCDAPVAVMWSEFEAEEFAQQGKKMCERIREIGGTAHATLVAGHNHFSPVLSLGSGDRSFARLVRQFVAHPAERAR